MELRDYLAIIRRRVLVIVLTVLATVIIALTGTWLMTPRYEAEAKLRLATATSGSISSIDFEVGYAERLMNTYVEIAGSRPVREALREQFNLNNLPRTDAKIIADTELLVVMVDDTNPARAAAMADALAAMLVETSLRPPAGTEATAASLLKDQVDLAELELADAQRALEELPLSDADDSRVVAAQRLFELKQDIYLNLLSQYELVRAREAIQANVLTLIEPAVPPSRPSSPNLMLNLALAVVLGLAGGVALAFLVENLDTTIYSADEVGSLMATPTLGVIPTADFPTQDQPLMNGLSPTGDAFRRLYLNIQALYDGVAAPRTILVTSAVPREGKSTVASNLAHTMSQQGRQVVVVDADMRLPRLHDIFGVANNVGLSSILTGETTLDAALRRVQGAVTLLSSGPAVASPPKLLASPRMRQLLDDLSARFEAVIIDAPAYLAVSDATALVPRVDCVLLVVACRHSTRTAVTEVRDQLAMARAEAIHVVVNRAERHASAYDYYEQDEPPPLPVNGRGRTNGEV